MADDVELRVTDKSTFFLPFLPRFCIRLDCQLLAPAADAIESLAPFQCRVDAHHVV